MLTIYTINDNTEYAIRLTGSRFTAQDYNIAVAAMDKTFKTKEEAQAWIDRKRG